MILTTGCNRWEQGIDVVVEGVAVHITDDRVLERLAEAWAREVGTGDGEWVSAMALFAMTTARPSWSSPVTPAKALAFAKGGFSRTRHLF